MLRGIVERHLLPLCRYIVCFYFQMPRLQFSSFLAQAFWAILPEPA